jgi:endoplasmic reticulum-Golgi intermediate compartment protein 2
MDVEINFTHIIDEFSFGEYYPKIDNPLDFTSAQTDESTLFSWGEANETDMYRFQYFVSIVPTTYIVNDFNSKIIDTFQYAVTEQSHPSASVKGQEVPGTRPRRPCSLWTNPCQESSSSLMSSRFN